MITRLHSKDNEKQKMHCFIMGLTQAIQDELYLFRITNMHEEMAKAQKVKLKLSKAPTPIVLARSATPSTTTSTTATTSVGPLVC